MQTFLILFVNRACFNNVGIIEHWIFWRTTLTYWKLLKVKINFVKLLSGATKKRLYLCYRGCFLLASDLRSEVKLTRFQKNPDFLFHRHFVLLRPIAIFPGSQRTIHVAPSHVAPATPKSLFITHDSSMTHHQNYKNLKEELMADINANLQQPECPLDVPIHQF